MGECGNHWKWLQFLSCKIWWKSVRKNIFRDQFVVLSFCEKVLLGLSALRARTVGPFSRGLPWSLLVSQCLLLALLLASGAEIYARPLLSPVVSRGLPWSPVFSRCLPWSPIAFRSVIRLVGYLLFSYKIFVFGPSVIVNHQFSLGSIARVIYSLYTVFYLL